MTRDVALWLVDLLKSKWDPAVESLRAEGTTLPKGTVPTVGKESDKKLAAFRLNNSVLLKVYQSAPERHNFPSWGMADKDTRAQWTVDIQVEHNDSARELLHAAWLVVDRILEQHRKGPEPDWDLIESYNRTQVEDYADYQHIAVDVTLARLGRIAATAIQDVTG